MKRRPHGVRDYLLWRPLLSGAVIAVCYGFLASAWIHISDAVAAAAADDKATLALFQEIKGNMFVVGTTLALFAFSFLVFRWVYRGTLDTLRAQEALLDAERRASAAMVSLSLAHDVNNQLQVLSGISYLLDRQKPALGQEASRLVTQLHDALQRVDALLAQMRSGGRRSAMTDLTTVELGGFVEDSLRYLRHHRRVKDCRISVDAPGPVELAVYPGVLYDALLNLVLNAGDAMDGQGEIRIRIAADPAGAAIEVHDSGPGVPPGMRERLFQAYHTTKADGTGLGLLAVRTCAELHGGSAEYCTSPLGGACFCITLRSQQAQTAA